MTSNISDAAAAHAATPVTSEELQGAAAALFDTTVEVRRHLHRHPELSFYEHETSAYVADQLRQMGVPFKKGFGKHTVRQTTPEGEAEVELDGHGIVAYIEGAMPGHTVGLRADMDALPISEDANHTVCSENPGVMHACGHDIHTAQLLTVTRMLWERRSRLAGRYVIVFQPGEESWPGGASLMIAEGALESFGCTPEVVLGAHVLAEMPVGHVGFREGTYMASGDEIHLHISGRGGHGGMPHLVTDQVLIGCETVVAMQHLVAREVPATVPLVLSFGKFMANGATNVIPDTTYICGTMRTMNETWRARMKERITTVAQSIASAYGAHTEVEIRHGYPSVCNNEALTAQATELAKEMLGAEAVESMPLRMTAEDFGYYTQRYPSVFYRFGVGSPAGAHTPQFEPNEEALRTAPAVMAWLAVKMAEKE